MPAPDERGATVLVTDAERGSALAIIRSFSRRGWRVIAAASLPWSPGFYSRYTDRRLLYPSPVTASEQFLEVMLRAVQENGVDLIIPVTDEVIMPLARERETFEALCKLAMPDTDILMQTRDKAQTMAMARKLDVPLPRTFIVDTVDEAMACAQELPLPIVLKPALSRKLDPQTGKTEKFAVSYANDLQTLTAQMQDYEGRCSVLMQEYFAGEGQGVELLAWEGQPLAVFQHRRLCEIPVQGGASALRESMALDPVLYDYACRLTAGLNWSGLLMVEFKVGEQGARLMEINGRVWGSLPLAVASGMDFPGRLADLYAGVQVTTPGGPPASGYRAGVRVANAQMLLMWLLQVLWGQRRYEFLPFPPRREVLTVLRQTLNPAQRYDILSLSDPRPGLAMLLQLSRKLLCKIGVLS